MASSANPLRTLLRPAGPVARGLHPGVIYFGASFSTTALLAKGPPAKAGAVQSQKQKKTFKKKGAQSAAPARKPNPGERKAFRKRIQLSNNSALEVQGINVLESGVMTDGASAGKMFSLPDQLVDQLRTLEAFKPTQSWNLFRKPHVLLRQEIVNLIDRLGSAAESKKAARIVLRGSRLSGKSLALLQAMSYALFNNWVVIHIPEANDLTNGNTEFSPIPDTEPMQFAQPVYTLKLLQNIHSANKKVFDGLKLEKDWSRLNNNLKSGSTFSDLILSCKESEFAWPTFNALWTELTLPGRPPLLFTLDGLAHINKLSEYKDPSFNSVHSHDLTLVRTFVDALSGTTKLPNGGAVLAAASENNTHHHPSQELVLAQLEAIQAKQEAPLPDPYEKKYDDRVYDALKNCEVMRLEGVSHDDARTLMQYWGASGMLRSIVNNQTVKEKWALGGHGIIGEMERAALMTMRM